MSLPTMQDLLTASTLASQHTPTPANESTAVAPTDAAHFYASMAPAPTPIPSPLPLDIMIPRAPAVTGEAVKHLQASERSLMSDFDRLRGEFARPSIEDITLKAKYTESFEKACFTSHEKFIAFDEKLEKLSRAVAKSEKSSAQDQSAKNQPIFRELHDLFLIYKAELTQLRETLENIAKAHGGVDFYKYDVNFDFQIIGNQHRPAGSGKRPKSWYEQKREKEAKEKAAVRQELELVRDQAFKRPLPVPSLPNHYYPSHFNIGEPHPESPFSMHPAIYEAQAPRPKKTRITHSNSILSAVSSPVPSPRLEPTKINRVKLTPSTSSAAPFPMEPDFPMRNTSLGTPSPAFMEQQHMQQQRMQHYHLQQQHIQQHISQPLSNEFAEMEANKSGLQTEIVYLSKQVGYVKDHLRSLQGNEAAINDTLRRLNEQAQHLECEKRKLQGEIGDLRRTMSDIDGFH